MEWTEKQQAELAHQYARIGFRANERWAAPPPELGPHELLAHMCTIPDGTGHDGWLATLRGTA